MTARTLMRVRIRILFEFIINANLNNYKCKAVIYKLPFANFSHLMIKLSREAGFILVVKSLEDTISKHNLEYLKWKLFHLISRCRVQKNTNKWPQNMSRTISI